MARRYTGGFISATEQVTDANSANGVFTLAEAQVRTSLGEFPTGRWTPSRSLRFRRSASGFLNRTPATASNRRTWTFSGWFKRGLLVDENHIFTSGSLASQWASIQFMAGSFQIIETQNGITYRLVSTAAYRDPSAWYHVVVAMDTTQAIERNRLKLYVNGVQVTSFTTETYPTQNLQTYYNSATQHGLGRLFDGATSYFYDGLIAETNFIDGQALTPSEFGFTDPETGTWVPKLYTGTYGTNGFYLPFTDHNVAASGQVGFGTNYAGVYTGTANLLSFSEQFDNAFWAKGSFSSSATNITDPFGGTTAESYTSSTTDFAFAAQINCLAGQTYNASVWLKVPSGSLNVNLYAYKPSPFVATGTKTVTVTTSWQRFDFDFTGVDNISSMAIQFGGGNSIGNGQTIHVWGGQVTLGSGVKSYMQTTDRNYWTSNNISNTRTAVTYDSLVDVPGIATVSSLPDVGGVQRGNYPIMSPADNFASATVSNAGLTVTTTNPGNDRHIGCSMAFPSTGKWYWENTVSISDASDARNGMVLMETESFDLIGSETTPAIIFTCQGTGINVYNGAISNANVNEAIRTGGGGTVCFAYDADEGRLWIRKNSAITTSLTPNVLNLYNPRGALRFRIVEYSGSITATNNLNFGQRPFAYTPPAGFKSLNTTNLPNPVIRRPEQHFDVKTYVGNGSSLTIGTTVKQTSAHRISKSVEFDSSIQSHFTRTPSSASNRRTWTWSAWVKRNVLGTDQRFFAAGNSDSTNGSFSFAFGTSNAIRMTAHNVAGNETNQLFTSTSDWYNIVISCDTTQVSAFNRMRIFVNGVYYPFSSYTAVPTQNQDLQINNNVLHTIGRHALNNGNHCDLYIAEVNFVDGQSLTASPFGEFDANSNWMPKRYIGTYGTNGYYLPFSDDRNVITLGYDTSGNNNNWTAVNITPPIPNSAPNVLYYGTPGTYTWVAPTGVTSVNYLVVAGGGGGGGNNHTVATGGGGGAGGMLTGTLSVTPGTSYTVTVGSGGAGGTGGAGTNGTNGTNSVFASLTSIGGGGGATNQKAGLSGGSGGGASGPTTPGSFAGGAGTAGQGNNGGSANQYQGGGGGGAGGVGDGPSNNPNGGAGLASSITGVSAFYAGGGGVTGGIGGGGNQGFAGVNNTGGGGGNGAGGANNPGASGGAGVVILSYTNASSYIGTGAETSLFNSAPFDTPTDYDDGTGVRGNYATMTSSTATITNGGLRVVTSSGESCASSTLSMTTGKWYFEAACTGNVTTGSAVGIVQAATYTSAHNMYEGSNRGYGYYGGGSGQGIFTNMPGSSPQSYGASWTTGDTIGCAFDADNGTLQFFKNGVSQGVYSGVVRNIEYRFAVGEGEGSATASFNINFGQNGFTYAPPSGFRALNTKNLKDVGSFNLPDSFGNFVTTPDLVWLKARSTASYGHRWTDTVRGPTRQLLSHDTGAQTTDTGGVQTFLPNGFQLANGQDYNNTGTSYVSWAWNRGRIPGFDIVSYGGNGAANQTIAHNLGNLPKMMIVKSTTNGTASWNSWNVWHANLSNGAQSYLRLNESAVQNTSGAVWGNAPPGNFTFSVGNSAGAGLNGTGDAFIAYLWAEVPGFSSFGSYTGNGSTDGPFIYTGFRPKWIMIKRTDATASWMIVDAARDPINPSSVALFAQLANAEAAGDAKDFVSNGFKIRSTGASENASGGNYVYAAFADAPFKYANAR